MRYPTLSELPPPPPGKTGWPWTEESPPLPDTMPDGRPWPRVSIVTPSYNQAQFIEETIRSVLLQGYPDLEYIIIDGGSTDGSVDIIRKYAPWLAYWVSEPDRGQSHAINKGFARATGEICAWLNSDDSYVSGAVAHAVSTMHERRAEVVYGNCLMVDPEGKTLRIARPPQLTLRNLVRYWRDDHIPPQPSVFFSRRAFDAVGPLDEKLHYAMDYDLWLRLVQRHRFEHVDAVWSVYTVHPASKTYQGWESFTKEWYRVSRPFWRRFGAAIYFEYNFRYQGQRHLDRAFDAYAQKDWTKVRYHLVQAFLRRPGCFTNRGVRSVLVQSILGEKLFRELKAWVGMSP